MHIHFLDTYCPGESPLHGLEPRVKFISTLALIVALTATPPTAWPVYLMLAAVIGTALLLSGVSPSRLLRRSLIALPFTLVAATLIFTKEGRPLLSLPILTWRLNATYQGLILFLSIVVKSWLSVLAAVILSATTPFPDLLRAMRALGLPQVIVSTMAFMYRYLFLLADEALRLARARDSRSAALQGKGGGSLAWRTKVVGGMAGSLFLRSYERSERIYAAMLSRGFRGEIRSLSPSTLGPGEIMLTAFLLAFLSIIEALAHLYWR